MIAAIAAVALVIGAFFDLRQALASYLVGFLFAFGIALGSLGLALLHSLTGGRWGDTIAVPLRGAIATIPFFALLFLPIAIGYFIAGPLGGYLLREFGEVLREPQQMWWVVVAIGVVTAALMGLYDKIVSPRASSATS